MNGYIDAGIYIILSSISFVFLDKLTIHLNPLVILFVMSVTALLFFNFSSYRTLNKTYSAIWQSPIVYLLMSGSLALDWAFMLYASRNADPFIAMTSLFICLAIIGFMRLFFKKPHYSDIVSIGLLIISLVILFYNYTGRNGSNIRLGILFGSLAGAAFFIYIGSSVKFAQKHSLTTLQILSCRFWLLGLGSAAFVPMTELMQLSLYDLILLVLISFASLIIPIYFNQRAISKLGAELTSIFISLVPPVTFIVYSGYNHIFNMINSLICTLISIALILPKLIRLAKLNGK